MNPAKYLLTKAAGRAKAAGLEFAITEADLLPLPERCPVVGIPLDYRFRECSGKRGRMNPHSPTVDRLDSTKGYVPGNVMVMSDRANRLKNDATLHELAVMGLWATFRLAQKTRNP